LAKCLIGALETVGTSLLTFLARVVFLDATLLDFLEVFFGAFSAADLTAFGLAITNVKYFFKLVNI